MKQSIEVLAKQLFDYAGLFPPAKLSLQKALTKYINYRQGSYKNMLGNFILPASQCVNTVSFFHTFKTYFEPIPFSILLTTVKTSVEFESVFYHDLINLEYLLQNSSKRWFIASFEIFFPLEFYEYDEKNLFGLLNMMLDRISLISNLQSSFDFFCEMPLFEGQKRTRFLSYIKKYNSLYGNKIFIKLRTGGTTPESIPNTLLLSEVIHDLSKFLLPFKVTAGLHVPVPNFNKDVNAKMHGFLNVMLSSMLAYIKEISISSIEDILNNLNYEHLKAEDNALTILIPFDSTKKIILSLSKISEFRKKYFKGIGTCDFMEPIEHLGEHFA